MILEYSYYDDFCHVVSRVKTSQPRKDLERYSNSNLALQHSQIYCTQDYSCTSLDNLLSSCTCVKASSLSLKDDDVVLLRKKISVIQSKLS